MILLSGFQKCYTSMVVALWHCHVYLIHWCLLTSLVSYMATNWEIHWSRWCVCCFSCLSFFAPPNGGSIAERQTETQVEH